MAKSAPQHSPGVATPEKLNRSLDYKSMETERLNRLLLELIQGLEITGLVDHNFRLCYELKADNGPCFFMELVQEFVVDVSKAVSTMENLLDEAKVDFKEVHFQYIKIKGSCSCFGASRILKASNDFHGGIQKKSREECSRALNGLKYEYNMLHEHLNKVVELERVIASRAT